MVEIVRREELEIEASLPGQRVRQCSGQLDSEKDLVTLRYRADDVTKIPVGILKRGFDHARFRIDLALHQPPDGVPLPRRRGKPHVTIGRDTPILLDDFYAADLRVGEEPVIPIAEDENIDGRSF